MITVTTDVFCDICGKWIFGTVGPEEDEWGARENAEKYGWIYTDEMKDVCPDCQKEIE